MDCDLTLGDSYPWLEDVLSATIDNAGLCLFSYLGYCEKAKPALLSACVAKAFVYSLLPQDYLLNDLDTLHMDAIRWGTHLFDWSSDGFIHQSESVSVYAVEMEDVGYARSDEAYAIHRIISKFSSRWSITLFRHRSSLLLSFLKPTKQDRYAIYLSDWILVDTPVIGQLERTHVANTSLNSPIDCFDGFMYEAIRPYYKEPISRASAVYDILDTMNVSNKIDLPLISREELNAAADKVLFYYPDLYGDDYLEDKDLEIDADDDFNLEDVEWELENAASEQVEESEERQTPLPLSFGDVQEPLPTYDDIPDDVMTNPIALLEWMDSHPSSETQTTTSSPMQKRLRIVPIGSQPPKIGSYVRYISMGKGIITWTDASHVSVDFEGTRRTFPFPGAFDSGSLVLLG